jgi:hypothetical protein
MVATSYSVVTPEVPGGGVINTKITEGRLALKWAGAATYLRDVDLIKNQERARLGSCKAGLYSRGQSFEDVDSNYIECNNIDASKDY